MASPLGVRGQGVDTARPWGLVVVLRMGIDHVLAPSQLDGATHSRE
jgi:hypothetical protein